MMGRIVAKPPLTREELLREMAADVKQIAGNLKRMRRVQSGAAGLWMLKLTLISMIPVLLYQVFHVSFHIF